MVEENTLTHCDLCGNELESRGDCSNRACWSHANIERELLASAKARKNLSVTCTGGGFDYINRVLWDNGPEMILHALGDEPPGPERLDEPCEVWLWPTADWTLGLGGMIRFAFDTAVEGMDFMAAFTKAREGLS